MTRDEHGTIINQLMGMVSEEHQADASLLLTQLTDDYNDTLSTNERNCEDMNRLTEQNNQLKIANGELFMKVNQAGKENPIQKTEPKNDVVEKSYDDLFNEKGELK